MLSQKIDELCRNLNISKPTVSPQGEYFFSFDDSIFAMILEQSSLYVIWSLVGLLPSGESECNAMLSEIGSQSMRLLSGLTSTYFPIPFIANRELRLGIILPKEQNPDLIAPLTVLVEDVSLWRKGLRIGASAKPIIPHTSRILKF